MGEAAEKIVTENTPETKTAKTLRIGNCRAIVVEREGKWGPMFRTKIVQVYTTEKDGQQVEGSTDWLDEAQHPQAERALMLAHLWIRDEKERRKASRG